MRFRLGGKELVLKQFSVSSSYKFHLRNTQRLMICTHHLHSVLLPSSHRTHPLIRTFVFLKITFVNIRFNLA